MNILVLNCGSSSVKFQLIETSMEQIDANADRVLAKGSIEKIGMMAAIIKYQAGDIDHKDSAQILEHGVAIENVLKLLTDEELGVIRDRADIDAVGHRVVHGGEKFSKSVMIDDEVDKQIKDCIELAPLHNPANIRGYVIARRIMPNVPHAVVFDTAFHQTMPPHAYIYGLPYVVYQRHGIRRYGFHGSSHRFLTFRTEKILKKPRTEFKLITIHLGNGCSMAAVRHGKSIDTTMGFTPLEGLIMGTRSGDMDPAIILHLIAKEELSLHEAGTMLNKHSGLLGISGVSNDLRELLIEQEKGHEKASLAIEIFCYRLMKYVASYMGVLAGADAIAFTGGIGEHSPQVREKACAGLEFMGIDLDLERNQSENGKEALISKSDSKVKVFIIPTNEELVIARDTVRLIEGAI